ncbi:uncharacterized protein LOC120356474, partial [Nilaparvata lugens]|uniref:uncharacterized protein LOC120356474 n=1 Tax=Nilaparvata lugens TaxID=108931 RepID=UPI00193DEE89
MCRSSNRNVPSNMKMFPNDVATAEHLTHGDPNILDSTEFQPEQKEDYRELFGASKKPASAKKQSRPEWRIRSLRDAGGDSPTNGRRQSGTTHRQSGSTPRLVTHPRFINKALGRGSDHEVRIRSQSQPRLLQQQSDKLYNCHLCGFSASRINVIILHNKSHSAGYSDAFLPSLPGGKKAKKRSMSEKRLNVDGSPPVKRKAESDELKSSGKDSPSPSPVKKPIFGRKRSAKDKADKAAKEKRQTEEFRDNLLKDWDDDNEEEEGDNDIGSSKAKSVDDPVDNSKEQETSTKVDDSKSSPSKETSCFDFDDSEDGIKPEETIMQFGRKIPRLLGDRKKRTEDVEVERDDKVTRVEVTEEPVSQPEESEEERKSKEERKRKKSLMRLSKRCWRRLWHLLSLMCSPQMTKLWRTLVRR